MPNAKAAIVDPNGEPIHEKIDANINKRIVVYAAGVIGFLLTLISFFVIKIVNGVDTLKDNSNAFKTYIEKNDMRVLYLEQKLDANKRDDDETEKRMKELESREQQFWKEYGWMFIDHPKYK